MVLIWGIFVNDLLHLRPEIYSFLLLARSGPIYYEQNVISHGRDSREPNALFLQNNQYQWQTDTSRCTMHVLTWQLYRRFIWYIFFFVICKWRLDRVSLFSGTAVNFIRDTNTIIISYRCGCVNILKTLHLWRADVLLGNI